MAANDKLDKEKVKTHKQEAGPEKKEPKAGTPTEKEPKVVLSPAEGKKELKAATSADAKKDTKAGTPADAKKEPKAGTPADAKKEPKAGTPAEKDKGAESAKKKLKVDTGSTPPDAKPKSPPDTKAADASSPGELKS